MTSGQVHSHEEILVTRGTKSPNERVECQSFACSRILSARKTEGQQQRRLASQHTHGDRTAGAPPPTGEAVECRGVWFEFAVAHKAA